LGIIPVASEANGLRQPVHADDLAALAVRAIRANRALNLVSAACGGSTLKYRSMAGRIAAASTGNVRVVTLPGWLMSGVVRGLALLPSWRDVSAEMVTRQSRNLVFDDSALREQLGYDPRPFRPTPADFEIPDYAGKLQLAIER
jgi:uncharacterized protein YbjT (DUF2867 family)